MPSPLSLHWISDSRWDTPLIQIIDIDRTTYGGSAHDEWFTTKGTNKNPPMDKIRKPLEDIRACLDHFRNNIQDSIFVLNYLELSKLKAPHATESRIDCHLSRLWLLLLHVLRQYTDFFKDFTDWADGQVTAAKEAKKTCLDEARLEIGTIPEHIARIQDHIDQIEEEERELKDTLYSSLSG